MNRMFNYYTDAGHGWLEVYLSELEEFGIRNRISEFSYRSRAIAYLEEDLDMGLFFKEYEKRYGGKPWIFEKYTDGECFVRGLNRYY